ncbi:uncharacterized protein LOC135375572 isoform X3 [Ornithodoros turicata]|uniref:uncharacterized protein LOC135375572 isoform X3 n=1 Tax=Ornithodoros turicata TaxID=34597 RepID=UPI00313A0D8B
MSVLYSALVTCLPDFLCCLFVALPLPYLSLLNITTVMFAYVRYLYDDMRVVVSANTIKNFPSDIDVTDFNGNTEYPVYPVYWRGDKKTLGGYYDAQIIFLADDEDDAKTGGERKRLGKAPRREKEPHPTKDKKTSAGKRKHMERCKRRLELGLLDELDEDDDDCLVLQSEGRKVEKQLARCQRELHRYRKANLDLQEALAAKVIEADFLRTSLHCGCCQRHVMPGGQVHNQPVVVSSFEDSNVKIHPGATAGKGVLRWGGDFTIPETTISTLEGGAATSKVVAKRVDDCPMPITGISAFEGVTTSNDVAGQADSVTCGMAWETDSGGALETGIGIPQDAAEMEREPLMCIGSPGKDFFNVFSLVVILLCNVNSVLMWLQCRRHDAIPAEMLNVALASQVIAGITWNARRNGFTVDQLGSIALLLQPGNLSVGEKTRST